MTQTSRHIHTHASTCASMHTHGSTRTHTRHTHTSIHVGIHVCIHLVESGAPTASTGLGVTVTFDAASPAAEEVARVSTPSTGAIACISPDQKRMEGRKTAEADA
eukprot:GHVU01047245.1.p3 GENE.GHVU01047245.1~~GHVU01047245.1.p3  ORF type:complete len:105 (-),score=5.45 GHVU01047245.1:223-537(-)